MVWWFSVHKEMFIVCSWKRLCISQRWKDTKSQDFIFSLEIETEDESETASLIYLRGMKQIVPIMCIPTIKLSLGFHVSVEVAHLFLVIKMSAFTDCSLESSQRNFPTDGFVILASPWILWHLLASYRPHISVVLFPCLTYVVALVFYPDRFYAYAIPISLEMDKPIMKAGGLILSTDTLAFAHREDICAVRTSPLARCAQEVD